MFICHITGHRGEIIAWKGKRLTEAEEALKKLVGRLIHSGEIRLGRFSFG